MNIRNSKHRHWVSCRQGKTRRGLSLVEVLVALFVLGLTILPLFGLYSQSSAVVRIGRHDIEAMNFGSSFISQARKLLPRNVTCTNGDMKLLAIQNGQLRLGPVGVANTIEVPLLDQAIFQTTYSIASFAMSPANDGMLREAKQIVLKISWKESLGKDKSACFTALVIDDSISGH